MSMPRYAAKRDAKESDLVILARELGAYWICAAPLDGWLWWRGFWRLVEVKNPACEGHKDEYTPDQLKLMMSLRERGIAWHVWRTEADVYRDLGARRSA
jgi:hypothetical protein